MAAKILLVLIAIFIIIQFFKPTLNHSNGKAKPNAIGNVYTTSSQITKVLGKACNDCHSNDTKYPWYFRVQPVAWWLNHHVEEGKHELNFDEFLSYTPKKQDHKMKETIEQVKNDKMPLNSYTWVHKEAKLTEQEQQLLMDWANQVRKEITLKTGYTPKKK
ncbi:MAG TPA: heme-binding domain-containing protein [Chitinophagaceae bacterium]